MKRIQPFTGEFLRYTTEISQQENQFLSDCIGAGILPPLLTKISADFP